MHISPVSTRAQHAFSNADLDLKSAEHTLGPVPAARLFCVATPSNQIGITMDNQMTKKVKTKLEIAEDPILISSHTGTVTCRVTVV